MVTAILLLLQYCLQYKYNISGVFHKSQMLHVPCGLWGFVQKTNPNKTKWLELN